MIRYGSVCSGIEAATVAWHSLGWVPSFFSEIEKFPREVLAHHYPDVPLHGDFTTIGANQYGSIDLLVGGTPCQSFSIAGLRGGLDDDRGNLALEFIKLAQRTRPRWVVWENVPGVLSSNKGRDFGTFLTALGEIGYGFAYRVLDAQYFGVAQRRRRVFVVGYLGDWRRAAAVLFERESLSGNPAPSRKTRQDTSEAVTGGIGVSSGVYEHHGQDSRTKELGEVCTTVTAKYGTGGNNMPIVTERIDLPEKDVVGTLSDGAHMGGGLNGQDAYSGRIMAVAFQSNANAGDAASAGNDICPTMRGKDSPAVAYGLPGNWIGRKPMNGGNGDGFTEGDPMYTLNATGVHGVAHQVAIPINTMTVQGRPSDNLNPRMGLGIGKPGDPCPTITSAHSHAVAFGGDIARTLSARYDSSPCADRGMDVVAQSMSVRRLTPTECERLQGFPDGYTNIKEKCPDGPRYKALGNSMAVPVMRWIGERIQMMEDLCQSEN